MTPDTNKPAQSSEIGRKFLNILNRDTFNFRALPDSPEAKENNPSATVSIHSGTFNTHALALKQMNDKGCGVFVQINGSDGNGSRAANITKAECFFIDLDGPPLENIDRLGLKPHMIVNSSPNKWHAYWVVDDIPLEQFVSVQKRLAALMDSDQRITDLPRIMRLPGFLHMKDPNNPFLVSINTSSDHGPFAFEDFIAALETSEKTHRIEPPVRSAPRGNPSSSNEQSDLQRDKSALEHLIVNSGLDLGDRQQWINVGIALKNTHGDDGFDLWQKMSAAADGYVDEVDCQKTWDSFSPPDGPPLTIGTYIAKAKKAGWKAPRNPKGKKKKPAPAIIAVSLAEKAGDEFWMDMQGRPFVSFSVNRSDGKKRILHTVLDGRYYREELCARYTKFEVNKVLAKEQLNNAIQLLSAKSRKGPNHEVLLRTGESGDAIYITLGTPDGRAVEVTADGWKLVHDTPIRFLHRGEGMGELPEPKHGGTLDDFYRHYNTSPTDALRLVAVQIAALAGSPSHVIAVIDGGQGTGKSTLGDMVISLVDPPAQRKQARSNFSADERNLYIRASHAHMPYFDNISFVDQSSSDMLCRLTTGGSFSTRTLYTDDEERTVSVLRPILVTCIGSPTSRGDFLDRCVMVTALPVATRRTEQKVWASFEADRGKLFGFLLTAIQHHLRNRKTVLEAIENGNIKAPRMADFAAIIEGAAQFLGLKQGEFSEIMLTAQKLAQAESAMGDPLVIAIHDYLSVEKHELIKIRARDLLSKVKPYETPRNWPAVNKVKDRLRRNVQGLAALGITIEVSPPSGRANVMLFTLHRTENFQPSDRKTDENGPPF